MKVTVKAALLQLQGMTSRFRTRIQLKEIFKGVPLFCPLVCGDPLHPAAWNFVTKYLTLNYHMVKTQSLYLTWSWNGTGTVQTPRETDRRTELP